MGKKSREKQEKKDMPVEVKEYGGSSADILKKIIFVGTCLILFTPFVVSGKYFFPFVGVKSIYFMGLVEIIFISWLILAIFNKKYRPRWNVLLATLALFLLVQIISSVLGVDFIRSFWSKYERMTGLLMQLHLFAFFLVISSVFKKKIEWLRIFGVSVAAAIVMSFLSLLPGFGVNALGDLTSAARQGVTLGNSSFLGTYLLFNFFFAVYLFLDSKNVGKIFAASAGVIILITLIFSTARAATVATVVGGVLLFLLWLIFARGKKSRIVGISLLAFLSVTVAVSTYLIFTPGNLLHDLMDARYFGDSFGGRFAVWGSAWKSFLAKPAFGWGPENFEIVFTKYFNPCLLGQNCGSDIWYDRAHNVVFDTLASTGIIGFLSYLGVFAAFFYVLWRKFAKKIVGFWTAGIFSVILVAYFVQNLTVFDMINSYMLFFLVLGFVGSIAQVREDGVDPDENKKGRPINFFAVVVILAIFIPPFMMSIVQPLKADRDVIVSLNLPYGSPERLDSYKKTIDESSLGRYQIRDFFAQETMSVFQGKNLTQDQIKVMQPELNFVIQETEKSVSESPWDFRAYLKLGQLYNTYAILYDPTALSKADEALQAAITASPTNQQGYWSLAQTKLYEGQTQKALSLSEQALALEPDSKQANLIVIQVAKIIGDEDLVQQKISEALQNNPDLQEDINNLLGTTTSQ